MNKFSFSIQQQKFIKIFSGSTDKLPSTALMNNKENDLTSSNEVDTEDDLNNISSSLSSAWVDDIRWMNFFFFSKRYIFFNKKGITVEIYIYFIAD